jgi:hypothetical protein
MAALAVGLLCVAASAQAEAPSLAAASADSAALAAFLDDCAGRLTKNDVGLARVARVCPGIDYAIAHGPLSGSLRDREWPRDLDQQRLRNLARLADIDTLQAQFWFDLGRLKSELARVNVQHAEPRSWWQRLLDRFDRWLTSGRAQTKWPEWLRAWLDRLHVNSELPRWAGLAITRVLPAAFLVAAIILGLRRGGVLRRLVEWRFGARDAVPTGARDLAAAAPRAPAGLAERFGALIATLESRGLLANARALTCRELARSTAGRADLDGLGSIAGIVERLRYGDMPPSPDTLASAETRLSALALAQRIGE